MLEDGYGCQVQKTLAVAKKRNLKKKDLQSIANISSTSITKLAKDETVRTDTLDKFVWHFNVIYPTSWKLLKKGGTSNELV